jgi:hypothetical protein
MALHHLQCLRQHVVRLYVQHSQQELWLGYMHLLIQEMFQPHQRIDYIHEHHEAYVGYL